MRADRDEIITPCNKESFFLFLTNDLPALHDYIFLNVIRIEDQNW